MEEEKNKPEIVPLLRGQAWVELHGEFYPAQLRAIADQIEENCKGLEKNDNQNRPDSELDSVA